MTFDGDDLNRTDLGDDYDPVVAEHFALLDQLKAPAYDTRPRERSGPALLHAPKPRFDPTYALAVAAAFLVIAAASYFALRPTSDLGLDTADNGDIVTGADENNPNQSAAVEDGDANGEKLTVEVAPSSTASPQIAAEPSNENSTGSGQGASGEADEGTTTTTAPATESETTVDGADSASSTTTSTGGEDSSSTTIDKDSVLAPPTTKPGITDPSLDIPATSFPADGADQMVVIRGVITELFTDCQAHYVLSGGAVEQLDAVSCDGGSYVVVDGKTIRTSAGFVPAGQYYNRHNPTLRPGQTVVVSATAASQTSAALTLNCAQCGISLGG